MKDPNVSVIVTTYNHIEFIGQCLDSILIQETNFPFEIILGEDESDDGTRDICIDYAKRHPDKIRLFLRSRKDVIYINGQPTGRHNFMECLKESRGKYIALCEGDDYWTNPLKLQKQVEFLRQNEPYGICFHNVYEENIFTKDRRLFPGNEEDIDLTIEDYVISNRTATCSMVFKKDLISEELPLWFKRLPFGDLGLVMLVLKNSNGRARVFHDNMGTYRVHPKGIHGNFRENGKQLVNAFKKHLEFTRIVKKELLKDEKFTPIIFRKMKQTTNKLFELNKANKNYASTIYYKVLTVLYSLRMKLYK